MEVGMEMEMEMGMGVEFTFGPSVDSMYEHEGLSKMDISSYGLAAAKEKYRTLGWSGVSSLNRSFIF